MEGHSHRQDQVLKPEDLTQSFELAAGQAVVLRPLRRDDHAIEHAFVSGLSPETRHNRLLGGMIQITREYVERLTTVDFSRDMALAAAVTLQGREVLIGVARYVLEADGRACEFALVIADAWQRRGLGQKMMGKLIAVARARGLERIYGDVLSTNRSMLDFCRKLGFTLGRNPEDATVTRAALALR